MKNIILIRKPILRIIIYKEGMIYRMRVSTTISKDIEVADQNAKYDAAVKRLLADKRILAWILKSCVEEFRDIEVKEIADKYIEGEPQVAEVSVMPDETKAPRVQGTGVEDVTITEGTVTFDIRFQAIAPQSWETISLIVNVEAQNDFYPGYPLIKRGIYYCSRMISSQYGTVFTKSHYEKIKKVYSIWICSNPPAGRKNTITGYSVNENNYIGEVQENKADYDLFTAIMICLGEPENGNYDGILKLLGVLLSSEMKPEQKKEILEHDFDIPMTEVLERQVEEMCNLSKGVEEKGIQKGYEAAELQNIKNLMQKLKMTAEQAMDALDIALDKRAKYSSMISK